MTKREYITFIIWLLILFFIIYFLDNTITFSIANRYPSSYFYQHPALNEKLTTFFKLITHLGEPNYIALGVIPTFIYAKYKKDKKLEILILGMVGVMILGALVSTALKFIFMRSRPYQEWNNLGFYYIKNVFQKKIPFTGGYMSFPSGHTMTASCGYFFLAFMSEKKYAKIIWIVLPILVGLSRVYLSFHWTSDVFASLGIGVFLAYRCQKKAKKRLAQ